MIDVFSGWLLRKLESIAGRYLPFKASFRRAPHNLLLHVKPGTAVKRIASVVPDAPYTVRDRYCIYKFKNLYLQVHSEDDTTIDAVTAVVPDTSGWSKFKIPFLTSAYDYRLGSLKMGDVISSDTVIQRDIGSKHGRFWIERYFGRAGGYRYYSFGLYNGPAVFYRDEFPFVNQDGVVVRGDIYPARINFISIASESGIGGLFDFWAME